jgi:phosphoribosylformylglycinamidine cyclo-ligase
VMVQSTDGVGTKSKVTVMAGRYEELGHDLGLCRRGPMTSW